MPIPYDASDAALFHPEQPFHPLPQPRGTPPPGPWPNGIVLGAECARLAYLQVELPSSAQGALLNQQLQRFGFGSATAFAPEGCSTQGFGAYRAADGCAVLALRGTQADQLMDVVQDARALMVPLRPEDGMGQGQVHDGFLAGARSVVQAMRTWLNSLPQPATQVLVCGHSLGAAIATLLALPLGAHHLVTIGSPRVGNQAFADGLSAKAGLTIDRLVDSADIVTMVPPGDSQARMAGLITAVSAAVSWLPGHADDPLTRLLTLAGASLDYRHVGRRHYIDRDGLLHADASDSAISADRLGDGLQLKTRLLHDHAPINYLRALWPDEFPAG